MFETSTTTGTITTGTGIGISTSIPAGFISSGTSVCVDDGIRWSSSNLLSTTVSNFNNMTQQVKVAVFEVTRDEKGKITSSKFLKELWVEKKNGISIDLVVAKELDKNFDPQNIVVKEIYSVSF